MDCSGAFELDLGSSPRVRGKLTGFVDHTVKKRLIPARAGKTYCHRSEHGCMGAHPRACGENSTWKKLTLKAAGSSPRVRGKLVGDKSHINCDRLIPARAGKT